MRILYLHQYFKTRDDAGGTRSYEMARRFVEAGHTVDLLAGETTARRRGYGTWNTRNVDGIRVHSIAAPYANEMSYSARLRAFAHFAAAATFKAAAVKADVVFASSTPLTIALPGIIASRRHRVPMVFEVRDLWPTMPIAMGAIRNPVAIRSAKRLERMAYRSATHVVALSSGMRDAIVRSGVDQEKVSIVPNCCDRDLFDVPPAAGEAFRQEHPMLGSRKLVLYAGTLGRVNGVQYLVEIAASTLTKAPDVAFVVIGGGHDTGLVREHAATRGVLDRNFFMLPPQPKRNIARALSACSLATSLFVDVPEMWVNSANKFFDALAAARPVMVNYGGWQAELLARSGAGIRVPSANPEVAAGQLIGLLSDAGSQERAREAARRLAREDFDRDVNARRLLHVLESVVSLEQRQYRAAPAH